MSDLMKSTERLVCHDCRRKWPIGAAAVHADHNPNCGRYSVHIHDTSEPCELCADDETENLGS